MICTDCADAADSFGYEDVSEAEREASHAKCKGAADDCGCQHKPHGSWNGGTK